MAVKYAGTFCRIYRLTTLSVEKIRSIFGAENINLKNADAIAIVI
jgi:hypothetical protein